MEINFDWQYYIDYHKDLRESGIDNKEKAFDHYLNHGKLENRVYREKTTFDWLFYIHYYQDLNLIGINTEEKAIEHWKDFGRYEGRLRRRNKIFDYKFYLNYYQDLKINNIDTEEKAYKHWISNGIIENRICNDTLLSENYILDSEDETDFDETKNFYKSYSDILEYIHRYAPHARVFNEKENYIDIDLYFYKKANNLQYETKETLMNHFHNNAYTGLIYHPKQLLNIYPNLKILENNKNIFIEYNDNYFILNDFINEYIYNKNFEYFTTILMKNIYNKLNKSHNILLLVFIGNLEIGNILIDKIINYKSIENFSISFCFNSIDIYNKMIDYIDENFIHYSIHISNQFGNDIIPTLLVYNNIKKKYNFKHIIKLQTKSNNDHFHELSDYILTKSIKNLINSEKQYSNCINNNKYYMRIINDIFNKDLITKYSNHINYNKSFIIGTIFYTKGIVFENVLNFMINNNFKAYLLNNMYDNNCTFLNNSYIHFLERLFGVINIKK